MSLNRPQPQRRRVQRALGDQTTQLITGGNPVFGEVKMDTLNVDEINCDHIYFNSTGHIQSKRVDNATSSDYVNILSNQIIVSRPSDDAGAAIAGFAIDTGGTPNGNGVLGNVSAGSGYGVKGKVEDAGTGNAVEGEVGSGGGYSGYFTGDAYFTADVSALTFTDRTPFYEGEALEDLKKIKGKGGKINHKTLPEFAKSKNKDKDGRDLGAMISILAKAIQELDDKKQDK